MGPRLGQTNGSGMKSSFGNGMYQAQMPQQQQNKFVRPVNRMNPGVGGNQQMNNFMSGQPDPFRAGIPGGLPNAMGPSQLMNGVPTPGMNPQNFGNDMRAQLLPPMQQEISAQMPQQNQAGSLPPMPQLGGMNRGFRNPMGQQFDRGRY